MKELLLTFQTVFVDGRNDIVVFGCERIVGKTGLD